MEVMLRPFRWLFEVKGNNPNDVHMSEIHVLSQQVQQAQLLSLSAV